jgi:subtilase family serine protease
MHAWFKVEGLCHCQKLRDRLSGNLFSIGLLAALGPAVFPAGAGELQVIPMHLPAVAQLSPVGKVSGSAHLNLAISLPLRNQAALTNLLREIYDPASPNYHHYLTPAEFTEKFGPSEADYQAVAAFARANHLLVNTIHPNRMVLDVDGSVTDVERALHVTLRTYQHPTEHRTFYAPEGAPTLDLATPILQISGLDNFALPKPRYMIKPSVSNSRAVPDAGSGPNGNYLGGDFRAAYVPDTTLTGAGQAVGLLQFDGYTPSDIAYYENKAGLPSVPLQNVLLDGFSGHPSHNGGEVEVSLDIEMSISMAPGLSQVIVYMAGPGGNWHDILNRMATDNLARQLSCSWYIPGGPEDPTADQIWQEMAAQGQTFFAASGDDDAYTGLINFPNDSPYITQVGGTTLTTTGPTGAYVSETVWNWGAAAAAAAGSVRNIRFRAGRRTSA